MSIVEAAKARYSTKAFDPTKTLTNEQIQELKDLVRMSASSVNSQPWHFILAGTKEGKARIAKATQDQYGFNNAKVLNASHVFVFCTKTQIDNQYLDALLAQEDKDGRFANPELKQTVAAGRKFFVGLHNEELKDAPEWMEKQVYLNAGTLLLGASAIGVDAVPIEGFDKEILDKEFGLAQKGLKSSVIVAVGYRSEDDFNAKLPKSRWGESQVFTEI